MKKLIPAVLILLYPLWGACQGFTVNGFVEGLQSGTVTLAFINKAGEDTTLTAAIVEGKFSFRGQVPEPEMAKFTVTQGWPYNTSFFLEYGTITFNAAKDAPEKTVITGSASDVIYRQLKPGLMTYFADARQNESAHQQNAGPVALKSADSLWAIQQQKWMQRIRSAITEKAENYAALYFIQWLLFKPDDLPGIHQLFIQLAPEVRNGFAGKKFTADFEHLFQISIGQPAPEISGKDTAGHTVTLAALKGKVVLLDFWASYCGPCRQENGRLLQLYKKYHPLGFEIISFSLDYDRSLWLKAVQTDGLLWPQATDLRAGAGATANTYDITDLPRNVLIDKTGKIIAKDVHGVNLVEALDEWLK